MGENQVVLGRAESLCPMCLKRLDAKKIIEDGRVYLEKTCPEHGSFRTLIWDEAQSYAHWAREIPPARPDACATGVDKGCPYDCGLCPEHCQRSCCVLLEITQRCNLGCPVCFASAGEAGSADPSLETIGAWLDMLLKSGGPFNIQLSGGEPTVRADLEEIIRLVKDKGFYFVQLNTNGLRLAEEAGYAKSLQRAGLDCVYLQFDGVSDGPHRALRGRPLWEIKQRAVRNCAEAGLGTVLVPTLAPGVNDSEVGAILRFAFDNLPWVRGVHFQPISYFGRHPGAPKDADRITLPALLRAIEEQTEGLLRAEHFGPSGGQNAYCGFNGSFLLEEDGSIRPLSTSGGCCGGGSARAAQEYVARRWAAPEAACCGESAEPICCDGSVESTCCQEECQETTCYGESTASCCGEGPETSCCVENEDSACCYGGGQEAACCGESIYTDPLDAFLRRVKSYSLAVSCMVFQDVWNVELDRLRQCHIHVVSPEGKLIPFCAYNLTASDGRALYRGQA